LAGRWRLAAGSRNMVGAVGGADENSLMSE